MIEILEAPAIARGTCQILCATYIAKVEPAHHIHWRRVLSIGACVLGLWAAYQLRVRRIASELKSRFDERMAERNRLSSELHDTFLQSVEASKMVLDQALAEQPDPERMRSAMETLSGWLAQATTDGRAALNSLRSSASLSNDLAEAIQRAADVAGAAGSIKVIVTVEGTPRGVHPIVRDEIVRIGSEAIRNASQYSGGRRLAVKICYGRDLLIRLSDNGLGVREEFAGKSRPLNVAHIKEQASRIGGQIRESSNPNASREIELRVPGRIAFHNDNQRSAFAKPRARWNRTDRNRQG